MRRVSLKNVTVSFRGIYLRKLRGCNNVFRSLIGTTLIKYTFALCFCPPVRVKSQEANIGVGIFGKEGSQAARSRYNFYIYYSSYYFCYCCYYYRTICFSFFFFDFHRLSITSLFTLQTFIPHRGARGPDDWSILPSDYAIHRFHHVKRLLTVHGRYSLVRNALLTHYSFYKNAAIFMCQIWFSFFTGYSGLYLQWWRLVFIVILRPQLDDLRDIFRKIDRIPLWLIFSFLLSRPISLWWLDHDLLQHLHHCPASSYSR